MSKLTTKYFIIKDFIGYPTDIVRAEYDYFGHKIKGDCRAPQKTGKRFPGFDSLEEILDYKICSCGKGNCEVNALLKKIVSEKINKLANAN